MAGFRIFAPFIAFALLLLVAPATVSLFAAAALSLVMVGYDVARGGSVKLIAAGSVLLFTALGGYVALVDRDWSDTALHLAVDLGVLAIALLSLLIRFPFTLQYAREQVDAETTRLPGFRHANYVITWAWTAAFLLMLVADMLQILWPALPLWIGFALAFAARQAALAFTRWYPAYRRARSAAATAASAQAVAAKAVAPTGKP